MKQQSQLKFVVIIIVCSHTLQADVTDFAARNVCRIFRLAARNDCRIFSLSAKYDTLQFVPMPKKILVPA